MRRALFLGLLALVACKRKELPVARTIWLAPDHGCAQYKDSRTICWGPNAPAFKNEDPLMAPPVEEAKRAPEDLPGGFKYADVKSSAKNDDHGCLVTKSGSVKCWGKNDFGQLGDGTRNASNEPVNVHAISDVALIGVGAHHTCALLMNGTVSCWGKNDHHQLANGTTEASSSPVPVVGLVQIREIAVAGDGACVILGDGEIRCWGANDKGQLGSTRRPDHDVPASIVMPR